jgi:hypothetical protein
MHACMTDLTRTLRCPSRAPPLVSHTDMQDLQVHVYACMPRNPSNETMRMWPQTLTTAQRPARTSSGLVGPGVVILCNDAV